MGLGEKYIASAEKGTAARLNEPVLGTLFVQRSGAMAAGLRGAVTGIGGLPKGDAIHREGGKDTKLPQSYLLAVTAADVHVFAFKMFWGKTKVKQELGSFPRAGLQLQTNDGSVSQFLISSPEPPQTMCFEAARWGKKTVAVIDRMVELLRDPSAT
jgi:hypothetical protein